MLAGRVILVMVAARFPWPELREDVVDIIVGVCAALSGAALQKLDEIVNVLPGPVGERSQAIHVPAEVNESRAAPGEAQDVGGCEGVDAVEVRRAVGGRRRRLSLQCSARRDARRRLAPVSGRLGSKTTARRRCQVRQLDCIETHEFLFACIDAVECSVATSHAQVEGTLEIAPSLHVFSSYQFDLPTCVELLQASAKPDAQLLRIDATNPIKKENTTTPLVPQQRPVPAYDTRERRHPATDRHKSDRIHRTPTERNAPRLDAVPPRQRRSQ